MIEKIFPKSETLRNIFTLMSATVISQAVSMLVSPILSRLYTPKDFGIFATYGAIVGLATIVSTGRYELAVMLPEKDSDAVNIIALSMLICAGLSLLSLILLLFLNSELVHLIKIKELRLWFYVMPLSILLTGIFQSFSYWLNRNKRYNDLAATRVSQSIITTIVNLGFGLLALGSDGLIGAGLLGQIIAVIIILYKVLNKDISRLKELSVFKIKENAKKYKDFPKINMLHSFIDTFQQSSIIFFMGIMFSPSVLGNYSYSRRVLKAPADILTTSISDISFQKISETYVNGGNLNLLLKNTIKRLSMMAFPVFLPIMLFGPFIFSFVFGKKWESAGLYSQILSPWILLNFIASPVSSTPIVLQKQRVGFYFGLVYNLSICVPLFIVGFLTVNVTESLMAMSASASIVLIFYIFWILKLSELPEKNRHNG